ncbi:NADH:flavin oxidoreductase/NADH oxidase family protein [uncultured Tateyamaria sp.]|uniref:NADH:flavin oxidoreductase/NADH oxidase family protein n=1 Tax=uncultured Tateyamaria sp. TaxID=455651 RepID=UPI00262281D2|nr:NADH:flavin oxidoreductase/NADH oxidase family protein [uncultured Tateyamaria sp.]
MSARTKMPNCKGVVDMNVSNTNVLSQPLHLSCGVVLKNRIVKSAMSDSLGDGRGAPTDAQIRLYERWADGGLALSIIGEVQGTPDYAEKPGNLVLNTHSDSERFMALADSGSNNNAQLWLQLGHAGAMADASISNPKGPSALDFPGLTCGALTLAEIEKLPNEFARTAVLAKEFGFAGVEIHAAHGFLLSQFLSPLFNKRTDEYGGSVEKRLRLVLETVKAVRSAVGRHFPMGIKLNASDQLEGGFQQEDALAVIAALDSTDIDLIDISGGTYFPSAPSSPDRDGAGPYFLDFAGRAKTKTKIPVMVTGGFKTFQQAEMAVSEGKADLVGLARALVIDPDLPKKWEMGCEENPLFPRFDNPPEGGVTAWYTMQITQIANREIELTPADLPATIKAYEARDDQRRATWTEHFGS